MIQGSQRKRKRREVHKYLATTRSKEKMIENRLENNLQELYMAIVWRAEFIRDNSDLLAKQIGI